jgi:hypothetical protein
MDAGAAWVRFVAKRLAAMLYRCQRGLLGAESLIDRAKMQVAVPRLVADLVSRHFPEVVAQMNTIKFKTLLAIALFFGSSACAMAACPPAANQVCVITSGTTNTTSLLALAYATYSWDSPSMFPKAESIGISCTSTSSNGNTIIIKDEIGNAATYPIVVTPQSTDTIDGLTSFSLNSNHESITLQCDGAPSGLVPNWIVE